MGYVASRQITNKIVIIDEDNEFSLQVFGDEEEVIVDLTNEQMKELFGFWLSQLHVSQEERASLLNDLLQHDSRVQELERLLMNVGELLDEAKEACKHE